MKTVWMQTALGQSEIIFILRVFQISIGDKLLDDTVDFALIFGIVISFINIINKANAVCISEKREEIFGTGS